jgi:DNA repair exonuclease SbcCD nuclease subunit
MESNLTREQAKERKRELLLTFERMVAFAVSNDVRAIIIAGDLFDTTHIAKSAARLVEEQINGHPQIDFLYLKGNHEKDNFLTGLSKIAENLKVFGDTWTRFSYGEITVSGVELTSDNSKNIYDSLVLAQDEVNLVVLHGQESQYDVKDNAEIINIRALQNKYIDYLALGHIHEYKYQKLDNRGNYCYCGCLEGRGFDEIGEKGFVLLDIENKHVWPSFIPFAKRTCREVSVPILGLHTTSEIAKRIEEHLADVDKSSLVKIVLTGEIDMDTDKDIIYLTQKFAEQYYFVKIYDHTRLAINYEAFRLDQSLKGEFIRLLENADMPQEEKDAVILTGIRALSGEEI